MRLINSFRGNYAFLSNFFVGASIIDNNGYEWKTSEHFYQAMKSTDRVIRENIRKCDTAGGSKKLGNEIMIRSDWNDIKLDVMRTALEMKFDQHDGYRGLLMQTYEYELIEGNWWHDNCWGNCYCDKCEGIKGQNLLGKCLMELRDSYIDEEKE